MKCAFPKVGGMLFQIIFLGIFEEIRELSKKTYRLYGFQRAIIEDGTADDTHELFIKFVK